MYMSEIDCFLAFIEDGQFDAKGAEELAVEFLEHHRTDNSGHFHFLDYEEYVR